MLPPARSPFRTTSGGLWALECVRERRPSTRRCRVGLGYLELWFPTVLVRWWQHGGISSLRHFFVPLVLYSGAGGESVEVGRPMSEVCTGVGVGRWQRVVLGSGRPAARVNLVFPG